MEYPKEIASALHEVMGKVGYVQKTKRNTFHNYSYAGEGDLLEALRPAMIDAGLILVPSFAESSGVDEYGNTHVVVEYTLAHKSGAVWPEKIRAAGCGNDKNSKGGIGDKGTYKALTGANKYLLFKLFQIETGDDPEKTEEDAAPPEKAEPKKANGKPEWATNLESRIDKAVDTQELQDLLAKDYAKELAATTDQARAHFNQLVVRRTAALSPNPFN